MNRIYFCWFAFAAVGMRYEGIFVCLSVLKRRLLCKYNKKYKQKVKSKVDRSTNMEISWLYFVRRIRDLYYLYFLVKLTQKYYTCKIKYVFLGIFLYKTKPLRLYYVSRSSVITTLKFCVYNFGKWVPVSTNERPLISWGSTNLDFQVFYILRGGPREPKWCYFFFKRRLVFAYVPKIAIKLTES